jgi:hypothetical protein
LARSGTWAKVEFKMARFEEGDTDKTIEEMFSKLSRIARMVTLDKDPVANVDRQATTKTLEMAEVRDARNSVYYHLVEGATLGGFLGRPNGGPSSRWFLRRWRLAGCWWASGEVLNSLTSGDLVSEFGRLRVIKWFQSPHPAPDVTTGEPSAGW